MFNFRDNQHGEKKVKKRGRRKGKRRRKKKKKKKKDKSEMKRTYQKQVFRGNISTFIIMSL